VLGIGKPTLVCYPERIRITFFLFLSGCFSIAGIVGLFYVITMGVMPPQDSVGQSKEFVLGWTLFFSLILGVPCLLAFIAGLIPWILWFRKSRNEA
jgi:protein-S-isoprenylcysteine O-methyltransferase Ste14